MNTLIIFGAKYLYLVIIITALIYLWRQPKVLQKKIIFSLVVVLPVTYIVAKIASQLYFDPRPFVVEDFTPLLPHINDNGFPSDHTLLGSALAVIFFFFQRRIGLFLLGIAFLVGLSRVFAGIHHLIDIIGSIVIASAVAYIFFVFLFPRAERKFFINKYK